MRLILLPALVCVVWGLVYALASNGKAAELGRLAFRFGLLWMVGATVVYLRR